MEQTMERRWHEVWREQCEAAETILLRHGVESAFDYAVGEKLLTFAAAAEAHPEFARALPRFVSELRRMFTPEEIEEHLARIERKRLQRDMDAMDVYDPELDDLAALGRRGAPLRVRQGAADRPGARHLVKPAAGRRQEAADREVLAGLVERVTFHNPENGFCVLQDPGAGASRPGHGCRPRRHGGARGVDHELRRMGERPHPRPAVPGAFHPHCGTVLGRGHREISGLGHDPGHRPGLRPQAGPGVRREGLRCHRGRAGTPARGDRHREGAGEADHRRLGRAEGRSARSWCSCTATASARRGRCGYSGSTARTPWR